MLDFTADGVAFVRFALLLPDAMLHGLESVLLLGQYFSKLLNAVPIDYLVYFELFTHN